MNRFTLAKAVTVLVVGVVLTTQPLVAQRQHFDLLTASVAEIQQAVAAGALSYEGLVTLYLARIAAYDQSGPKLNAILQINPRALNEARALDLERRTTGLRGPLHGIPVAVKDNIDVHDLPSAGGTVALAGSFPPRDATVVTKLRQAGAIIFLKTNMDELALGSQGLSSLGGQILNPYDLRHDPGGSSGGTAVAVNVGFAAIGVATETGLSIRGPAANNALVGIAPSRGLVSRAGVIPISFTQDRVGVHAKSVADAAALLTVLRGVDPEDLATSAALGTGGLSYLDEAPSEAVRVGVLKDLFRQGAEFEPANRLVNGAISKMKPQVEIVDDLSSGLDLLGMMGTLRVNNYELRFAFDAYMRRRGPVGPVGSLADLIASGQYLKALNSRFQTAMAVGSLDTDAGYLKRLAQQRVVRERLIDVMDKNQVEALAYPMKSLTAPLIGSADDGPRDNAISSTAGLPAIVLPAGVAPDGLPIAVELLGRPFSEPALLRIGKAYERAAGPRIVPQSTPGLTGEAFSY